MKTKHLIISGTVILMMVMLVLIVCPVPSDSEVSCLQASGIVSDVYEEGTHDIAFKLDGLDKTFYINRGLERGLELKTLKDALLNKTVLIKYPKYWTPLDPTNSLRHIAKLEYDGKVVFTEID
ncbi:hypothetical protein [Pseudochryseolinea flava]|uniref:Uncharacterized protein n=1 Tax=Pseudochryseolinea flava TaxID=2059302 RepID=A0A364Y7R8_9BACT|nr:hypothetical protein [Pseudochryseolinea flava]RAW02301.1 hypothetical protein DQQ10_07140 [Pseudochryseolinea flava]